MPMNCLKKQRNLVDVYLELNYRKCDVREDQIYEFTTNPSYLSTTPCAVPVGVVDGWHSCYYDW